MEPPPRGVAANQNEPAQVLAELLNAQTKHHLGDACGLSKAEVDAILLARDPNTNVPAVLVRGSVERPFQQLLKPIQWYVNDRARGHTPQYAFASITNRLHPPVVTNADYKVLLDEEYPGFVLGMVRKCEEGAYTNRVGTEAGWTGTTTFKNGRLVTNTFSRIRSKDQVVKWVRYVLIDGELAWCYQVTRDPGQPGPMFVQMRVDPKEYSPQYRDVILQVEAEVEAQQKKEGVFRGRVGNTFNLLKQQKLRSLGIEWSTPGELAPPRDPDNPFIAY